MRVGFQGELGAYSEEAVRLFLGERVECTPFNGFKQVFAALEDGTVSRAVIPIENSIAGPILEVHDLLLQHSASIVGEVDLRVHHQLLGLKEETLEQVRSVHSHPQALAQCATFIESRGLSPVAEYDTAGSAKLLAAGRLPIDSAAIASKAAASRYGRSILAENIEGEEENVTRFYLLCREPVKIRVRGKTAIAFALPNSPGALHRALGVFASRGINLSRLEARPRRTGPGEYMFFAEFEVSAPNPATDTALEELKGMTELLRVFGTFEKWEGQ